MGILEQVMRMKANGASESQVIRELSQGGVSPKDIQDALRQAQIKTAVSGVSEMQDDLQPSIMAEGEMPNSGQETYTPQAYEPQEQYAQEGAQQDYGQQGYYQPYQQDQGYAPQAASDTDTIIEIADQVFSDKIRKIQKQVDSSTEAMVLLQTKFESISERLKKIEMIIDRLQISILEKVGSYGNNLESIKKEMSMMQDSFSKMISPKKQQYNRYEEEISQPETENEVEEEISAPKRKISRRR